jgi:hypothetical protein
VPRSVALDLKNRFGGVQVVGTLAYVAAGDAGLKVVRIRGEGALNDAPKCRREIGA